MPHDSLSRVPTEKQGPNPFGSAAKTVTHTYDAESNLTKMDYPHGDAEVGFDVGRTYDDVGRLTEIDDGSSVSVQAMSYRGGGDRKSVLDHASTTAHSYGGNRRPTAIRHEDSTPTEFAGLAYGWDRSDSPVCEAQSHGGGNPTGPSTVSGSSASSGPPHGTDADRGQQRDGTQGAGDVAIEACDTPFVRDGDADIAFGPVISCGDWDIRTHIRGHGEIHRGRSRTYGAFYLVPHGIQPVGDVGMEPTSAEASDASKAAGGP